MYITVIVTNSSIAKAINNLFKEIFLIFSIVSGKDFGVFLELNIELVKWLSKTYL